MNFKLWLEDNSPLDQVVDSLRQQYPGLVLWAAEHENRINVSELKVPPAMRGSGVGSAVLNAIKIYAQSVGKPVTLSPVPDKGKKAALERFYKRNGFQWNKGVKKDYTLSSFYGSNMVWRPTK